MHDTKDTDKRHDEDLEKRLTALEKELRFLKEYDIKFMTMMAVFEHILVKNQLTSFSQITDMVTSMNKDAISHLYKS